MDEFHKWVPSIPVVMFHGTKEEREKIFRVNLQKNLKNGRPTPQFPVVCTSYEMVLREQASLSKVNWEFIIIVRILAPMALVTSRLLTPLSRTKVIA
jgi:ATP-dependent DNA helicase